MADFKVVLVAHDGEPPDWVVEQFSEAGVEFVVHCCANPDEVVSAAADADVVWDFGGSTIVTAEILPRLARCRVIVRTGSGTDNIPVDAATKEGIVVANTPEAIPDYVADHAIGLLLAVIRQIAVQDRWMREGKWNPHSALPNGHLTDQTLGLVGFGRIAQLVVRKISGFDMKVIATDPVVDVTTMARMGAESVSLDDLLKRSDFVSIHCPLTDGTRHLITERELRLMKPNAVLINTSRGPVIDESALIRALSEKWIGAAGLDVFEEEPARNDHPLFKLDNVVLTPHIAGYSDESYNNFWSHSVRTIIEISKNHWPIWYVNPGVKPRWEFSG